MLAVFRTSGGQHFLSFGTATTTDPISFLAGQVTYANDGQTTGMALGGSGSKTSGPTPVLTLSTTYDGIQRPVSVLQVPRSGARPEPLTMMGMCRASRRWYLHRVGGSLTENESFCSDTLNRLV